MNSHLSKSRHELSMPDSEKYFKIAPDYHAWLGR